MSDLSICLRENFNEIKTDRENGIDKLYKNYNDYIYRIAISFVKNKVDAEDILQNIYTKFLTISNDKLPRNGESSWLYKLIKNECIDYMRKTKPNISLDDILDLQDDYDFTDLAIEEYEYKRIVSGLNTREKEIVNLKLLSELSFNEISNFLKMPESTIKWIYYKSLHKLKLSFISLIVALGFGISALLRYLYLNSAGGAKAIEIMDGGDSTNIHNGTDIPYITVSEDFLFKGCVILAVILFIFGVVYIGSILITKYKNKSKH